MLEVLQFIFSSFWVWLGTVILLGVVAECLGGFYHVTIRKIIKRTQKEEEAE